MYIVLYESENKISMNQAKFGPNMVRALVSDLLSLTIWVATYGGFAYLCYSHMGAIYAKGYGVTRLSIHVY